MSKRKHSEAGTARKRRRVQESSSPNMICVICLCELAANDVHSHYLQYHSELMIEEEKSIKLRHVISAVTLSGNTDIDLLADGDCKMDYGDDGVLRTKLEALSESAKRKREMRRIPEKRIEFGSIPRFTLDSTTILNLNCQTAPDPVQYGLHKERHKKGTLSDGDGARSGFTSVWSQGRSVNDEAVSGPRVPRIATATRQMTVGEGQRGTLQSMMESLTRWQSNEHPLGGLVPDDMIPNDLAQCQSLIKMLFEQLWNSRAICDEQMMCIEYQNVIDAGNRMQIAFILKALKERHHDIYLDLYRRLQLDAEWRKWKKFRESDRRVSELKQRIERLCRSEEALRCQNRGDAVTRMTALQRDLILDLKEAQSAHVQRHGLTLKRVRRENGREEHRVDVAEDGVRGGPSGRDRDWSGERGDESLETVKSKDADRDSGGGGDVEEEDDGEWAVTAAHLIKELEGEMDVEEIKSKLKASGYRSEFEVLNDLLQRENGNGKRIRAQFTSLFGKLEDWGCRSLIGWCQSNKFYNLCPKVKSSRICGRSFIKLASNMDTLKRRFSGLTSPQVTQLYNRIRCYLEDSLSIL